jgi:hypothetical protein
MAKFYTKCAYTKSCTNPATHYIYTSVGDYPVCSKHAKIAESNKAVRYVKPRYGR